VARWYRVGPPITFSSTGVGWTWEIRREATTPRSIRVEVDPDLFVLSDLSAAVRNAIGSRGASAVDGFLNEGEPPGRIRISLEGVQRLNEEPTEI
jgi:hypothetical protein